MAAPGTPRQTALSQPRAFGARSIQESIKNELLATYYLLLTTYYLPLTTYHSLLTTYYLPLTTYLLLTTYSFGARSILENIKNKVAVRQVRPLCVTDCTRKEEGASSK